MSKFVLPLLSLLATATLLVPSHVSATNYQQCSPSSTCTIGEFLYNDDYTPLIGATCTLTANAPDGSSFLSSTPLVGRGDGWYSYDATTTATTGLYTATICCTPADGKMCLDKSFEVKTAAAGGGSTLTAADVWNYNNRTLTSFGSLVSDIWAHSDRTLSSFGSLVGDIWGHSTRQLTGTTSTSTTDTTKLDVMSNELKEQRTLLEKLANEPIIKTSLSDSPEPSLSDKFDAAQKHLTTLYDNATLQKSRLFTLLTKWDSLSDAAKASTLTTIKNSPLDSDLAWFSQAWDYPVIESLTKQNEALNTELNVLSQEVSRHPTSTPGSLIKTLEALDNLLPAIGDAATTDDDSTLFGLLESLQVRAQKLDDAKLATSQILTNWDDKSSHDQTALVTKAKKEVLSLNEYPGADSMLAGDSQTSTKPKNTLFALMALLDVNHRLLSQAVGTATNAVWLEDGSVIFRATMYNPSTVLTQTVPLKFFLPKEVKEGDIESKDSSLSQNYDTIEETMFVEGSYNLEPLQTKTVNVEVKDIWVITDSDIEAIKTKTATLLAPLEKSTVFSQGTTIASGIDTALTSINLKATKGATPESRIRAYRQNKLALLAVQSQVTRLEDLVAQNGASTSLVGYIGGTQVASTWGIIVVLLGGFALLGMYMYQMNNQKLLGAYATSGYTSQQMSAPSPDLLPPPQPEPLADPPKSGNFPWAFVAAAVIITGAVTAGGTYYVTSRQTKPTIAEVAAPVATPTPTTTPSATPTPSITPSFPSGIATPPDAATPVNVRSLPSTSGEIVKKLDTETEVLIFDTKGLWSHVGFVASDESESMWIKSEYIISK